MFYFSIIFLCIGNINITNGIGAVGHIIVIIAIELIDVKDLLIWTLFKARESVGYDVMFYFDRFLFGAKLFKYKAPAHYRLDFYDQYRL